MRIRRVVELLTIAIMVATLPQITASAQTYTDLHDFNCATEGCGPTYPALLAQGTDGNIYGTGLFGGAHNDGTVFRITPEGVLTVLYNFDGKHGSSPQGGLVLGPDGNLYGTTTFSNNYAGTIFKITPDGVLTKLHTFAGGTKDGAWPLTPPTLGNDGNFYGVTGVNQGVQPGWTGIGYRLSPKSGYKILTSALPATGGTYWAPLMQGWDGNFYSTTYDGGTNDSGTVYSMSPAGAVNVIYNFDTTHGGWGYAPLVQDTSGYLYGTAAQGGSQGGGVVFKVTTTGVLTVLHNFIHQDQTGGWLPAGGLVLGTDGKLYGSTFRGGSQNDGVLFKVTKSKAYTQLYALDGTDGTQIEGTAMQHTNGKIYGVTSEGGAYGGGVLYSLDVGMKPFVALLFNVGKVSTSVGLLGQGFESTKNVSFHGSPASFTVISDTYLTAVVPIGATTGFVSVTTSAGKLESNKQFVVEP